MKKSLIAISIGASLFFGYTNAEYIVKIKLDNDIKIRSWSSTNTLYGNWFDIGNVYDCSNWSPNPSTVTIGSSFEQIANDCKQNQERTAQNQEIETTSGIIRNVGEPYTNKQTINVTSKRIAIGTLENWIAFIPLYGNWLDSGVVYDCLTWNPDVSTIDINTAFTQTSNDCKKNQNRTVQNREKEVTTSEIRNVGSQTNESRTLTNQTSTRSATGTKETWIATTSTYGSWTKDGAIFGCSNWTPAVNTQTINSNFTQTATDCSQKETRTAQAREIETTTSEIRNVGSQTNESRTLTNQTSTRSATGTKETWIATTSTYGSWTKDGAIFGCSNWTPAVNTQTINSNFTQTATDCSQKETRTAQAREIETTTSEIRNVGSQTNESRTLTNQTSARSAIGTKETWIATTPTYTNWVNNGNVYDCNWTPSQSTILNKESFSQTATSCKQDQTRNQQNREQETTTLAYRNTGSPIVDKKAITINNNISRTSTGTANCLYSRESYNATYWQALEGSIRGVINKSTMIRANGSYETTSIVINGVTYTRGILSESNSIYAVCRS